MLTPTPTKTELFSADHLNLIEHLSIAKSYLAEASKIAEGYRHLYPQLATDCADAIHYTVEALNRAES